MYKSMFRPEVIRRFELCFFRPCKTSILASDIRNPPRGYLCWTLNFCLYKPCAMCLSLLHFQPCAGSEPDCNCCCCLSNKYTYMQLRSPVETRVNFHLTAPLRTMHWSYIMRIMTYLFRSDRKATQFGKMSTNSTFKKYQKSSQFYIFLFIQF